ncbi:MAG: hypothetical protein ACD_62C00144G0001 [uncultured bacterium]|nr:MAG: hypothetical protein ACD_62C00144G0001 [uncultured bacterium]HLD46115.1 hypothetical protein [bacterium]
MTLNFNVERYLQNQRGLSSQDSLGLWHEMAHAITDLIGERQGHSLYTSGILATEFDKVQSVCQQGFHNGLPTVTPYAATNIMEFTAETMTAYFNDGREFPFLVDDDLLTGGKFKNRLVQTSPLLCLAYTAFFSIDSPVRFDPWIFSDAALPYLERAEQEIVHWPDRVKKDSDEDVQYAIEYLYRELTAHRTH